MYSFGVNKLISQNRVQKTNAFVSNRTDNFVIIEYRLVRLEGNAYNVNPYNSIFF